MKSFEYLLGSVHIWKERGCIGCMRPMLDFSYGTTVLVANRHATHIFPYMHVNAHYLGEGVEQDGKRAQHYWELAAIWGNEVARFNLGIDEKNVGNMNTALKHLMIAARCGDNESLKNIREFYVNGHATKDDYAKALRAYQEYVDGIKSDQRDEAAAFSTVVSIAIMMSIVKEYPTTLTI